MLTWRETSNLVVGFTGAPGHQADDSLGAYKGDVKLIDRWDPATQIGDAWDRLLRSGLDVWAARAPSDFHNPSNDYWPGQFSETWVYAPQRTIDGVLYALRSGLGFAAHGQIAREVQLSIEADGLGRPAYAGEVVELPLASTVRLGLSGRIPQQDWLDDPNRIDEVEFIAVTKDGTESFTHQPPKTSSLDVDQLFQVPDGGCVVRARGRRRVIDGPDLMFYTNPIRITVAGPQTALDRSTVETPLERFRSVVGTRRVRVAAGVVLILLVLGAVSLPRLDSNVKQDVAIIADTSPRRLHYFMAAVTYTLFAVYGSLVPLNFVAVEFGEAVERFKELPYFQISIERRADWVANILLFIPLSFLWLGALAVDRTGRRHKVVVVPLVLLGCICLSVAIEFSQIWFPPRTTSQNDILAESIGGVIGVALWLAIGQPATVWLRRYIASATPKTQIDWLLQAYHIGLLIYSVLPLDLTIQPSELYRKYREGKIILLPFWNNELSGEGIWSRLTDILIFLPVGAYASTAWRREGEPLRSLRSSVVLGATITVLIECCQLLVYSRYSETTDAISGTLGVLLGAWLIRCWQPNIEDSSTALSVTRWGRSGKWLLLAVVYAVLLCPVFWYPFEIEQDHELIKTRLHGFVIVPFSRLYFGTEFNAATEILRKVLLFFPLGVCLGLAIQSASVPRPIRRFLYGVAFVSCIVLGTGIELVQSFLPPHFPDLTDTLLYSLGAVAGLSVVHRLGKVAPDVSDESCK